jgi:hypothetical protein
VNQKLVLFLKDSKAGFVDKQTPPKDFALLKGLRNTLLIDSPCMRLKQLTMSHTNTMGFPVVKFLPENLLVHLVETVEIDNGKHLSG